MAPVSGYLVRGQPIWILLWERIDRAAPAALPCAGPGERARGVVLRERGNGQKEAVVIAFMAIGMQPRWVQMPMQTTPLGSVALLDPGLVGLRIGPGLRRPTGAASSICFFGAVADVDRLPRQNTP